MPECRDVTSALLGASTLAQSKGRRHFWRAALVAAVLDCILSVACSEEPSGRSSGSRPSEEGVAGSAGRSSEHDEGGMSFTDGGTDSLAEAGAAGRYPGPGAAGGYTAGGVAGFTGSADGGARKSLR